MSEATRWLLLLGLAAAAGYTQLTPEDQQRLNNLMEAAGHPVVAIIPPKGDLVLLEPPFIQPPGGCARNKTVHLIRHAEGTHNAAEEEAKVTNAPGSNLNDGLCEVFNLVPS